MAVPHLRARARDLIIRAQRRLPAPFPPSLQHFLFASAAATSVSSSRPFDAEDYLVASCGLTRPQALQASVKISHLTSRSKPDAVLAFIRGTLGVPDADIAVLVARDPTILCVNVERTLAPRVGGLRVLGLSRDDIARLLPVASCSFRSRCLGRNLEFWLKELGSVDKLLQFARVNFCLLSGDLDKVGKPNVALLQQCGVKVSEISTVNMYTSRLLTINHGRLRDALKRVEEMGVEQGSPVFVRMLSMMIFVRPEVIAQRIRCLSEFGFSQDDMSLMLRKVPHLLALSTKKVQRNMEFLVQDVGLEASYIARRPVLINYSVEQRLLPRYRLLKVLGEKGLVDVKLEYYATASMAEAKFVQRFVLPYKDVVSGLADGYGSKWIELLGQKNGI